MKLRLTLLPDRLAVCRLEPSEPVPSWAHTGAFSSVTRTSAELSIVCAEDAVPPAVRREGGWRAFVLAGPLDFALIGVVASLAEPLARAGVPIFVLSTFDTDYLLVQRGRLGDAIAALKAAGHDVAGDVA
jgi:hypothetical protein